jgi:hypothetical protein
MFCPKCGTESSQNQRFCRSCGANLKIIGEAVSLSEAVARSDRGKMLNLKEMMNSIKINHTTEEISNALEKMNREIIGSFSPGIPRPRPRWMLRKEAEPAHRRENLFVTGTVSLFSGVALMIFLYYFSAALVLKIPPEKLAKLPFELEPVLKIIWLVGLLPIFSGLARIVAGFLIKPKEPNKVENGIQNKTFLQTDSTFAEAPKSVVENTTRLLDNQADAR